MVPSLPQSDTFVGHTTLLRRSVLIVLSTVDAVAAAVYILGITAGPSTPMVEGPKFGFNRLIVAL